MSIKSKFVEQVGVGASASINILQSNDIRISYGVEVTGTVTYTVQHNLNGVAFFDNTDSLNKTANIDGNYIFPVAKVRLNVTAGTGTAKLYVMQLVV